MTNCQSMANSSARGPLLTVQKCLSDPEPDHARSDLIKALWEHDIRSSHFDCKPINTWYAGLQLCTDCIVHFSSSSLFQKLKQVAILTGQLSVKCVAFMTIGLIDCCTNVHEAPSFGMLIAKNIGTSHQVLPDRRASSLNKVTEGKRLEGIVAQNEPPVLSL